MSYPVSPTTCPYNSQTTLKPGLIGGGPIQNTPPAAWKSLGLYNNSQALLQVRTSQVTDWLGPFQSGMFAVDRVTPDVIITPTSVGSGGIPSTAPQVWGTFFTETEQIPQNYPNVLSTLFVGPVLSDVDAVLFTQVPTTVSVAANAATGIFTLPVVFGNAISNRSIALRGLYLTGYDFTLTVGASFDIQSITSEFFGASIGPGSPLLEINHPGVAASGCCFSEKMFPRPIQLGFADGYTGVNNQTNWQLTVNALGTAGNENIIVTANVYGQLV